MQFDTVEISQRNNVGGLEQGRRRAIISIYA
jgi:hypothetical protein